MATAPTRSYYSHSLTPRDCHLRVTSSPVSKALLARCARRPSRGVLLLARINHDSTSLAGDIENVWPFGHKFVGGCVLGFGLDSAASVSRTKALFGAIPFALRSAERLFTAPRTPAARTRSNRTLTGSTGQLASRTVTRQGDKATRRQGDKATRRQGDKATRRPNSVPLTMEAEFASEVTAQRAWPTSTKTASGGRERSRRPKPRLVGADAPRAPWTTIPPSRWTWARTTSTWRSTCGSISPCWPPTYTSHSKAYRRSAAPSTRPLPLFVLLTHLCGRLTHL